MTEITLPYPSPNLSPNARVHWTTLSILKKKARKDGFYAAKEAGSIGFLGSGQIALSIEWYPKTRMWPDEDNAKATLKAYLDGIADAWQVNDNRFTFASFKNCDPVKGGKVVVRVGDA